jgi:hypothetical protein
MEKVNLFGQMVINILEVGVIIDFMVTVFIIKKNKTKQLEGNGLMGNLYIENEK